MTLHLLDTTALVDQLRGQRHVIEFLQTLVGEGHVLCVCCVNITEIERRVQPKERRAADHMLREMRYLSTTREAASRAGRYQAEYAAQGVTIHTPDALVAGTARAHGAVLVTANVRDFPMRDVRVLRQPMG